jgi:hydrogenase maturation protease
LPEVVVIGFGNDLRQDDGFGPAVILRASQTIVDPKVEFMACPTLTPELAEVLSHCRLAILIDASAELAPGVVDFREIAPTSDADLSLVHFLSPEALLGWTVRLYGQAPKTELWLVGSKETGLSETLTDVVEARVAEFVEALRRRIETLS